MENVPQGKLFLANVELTGGNEAQWNCRPVQRFVCAQHGHVVIGLKSLVR